MTTFSTPSQQKIFRAVAGAVRNAADGHPKWKLSRVMATSIAKRATGTLVSQWPELAVRPSESCGKGPIACHGAHAELGGRRHARGASQLAPVKAGSRRSPLRFLHDRVGFMIGEAKRAGQKERAEALVEVIRLIAEQQQRIGA